jgi:raffinose/stachyose/melibiose transport system substrate-binding protein
MSRTVYRAEFELSPMLDGVRQYIEEENMADYQDHYYPSEMAVDAQIQTLLIDKDVDAFLKKFDKDWQRYNRDIIQKVQKYEAEQTHSK